MILLALLTFIPILLCFENPKYIYTCDLISNNWRREPRLRLNLREILAPTAHGFKIIVDSTDQVVSLKILQSGSWEPQIMFLLSKLVRNGDKILNLGSQLGLEAVMMGKMIGSSGQMFLFEPYSVSYQMLTKNIFLNNLQNNSHVYKLAVGSKKIQKQKLSIDHENTGHSSLKTLDVNDGTEWIAVQKVDDILSKSKQSINLALIDVEMMEIDALLGMESVLRRSPQIIIVLEWRYLDNQARQEDRAIELVQLLKKLGFRWFRYEPKGSCQIGIASSLSEKQLFNIKQEDLILIGPKADLQIRLK